MYLIPTKQISRSTLLAGPGVRSLSVRPSVRLRLGKVRAVAPAEMDQTQMIRTAL
jgi:hypothetical protein